MFALHSQEYATNVALNGFMTGFFKINVKKTKNNYFIDFFTKYT